VNRGNRRSKRLLGLAAGLAAISVLAFAACGDDDDDDNGDGGDTTPSATETNGGDTDLSELGGEVRSDGSSTVFPISEAAAEEFRNAGAGTRVNVGFSGTGGGFERFCRGEIEVSAASRPIEDDEVQACADGGLTELVELQVAIDALTVVINPNNDFVTCLTVQQLHDIFTGTASTWDQVDPSFPAETIVRFFPGTDSGTFDYFVEAIIEAVDENATHTGDGTASEDDNVLAQGVEGEEFAIGYFGFAYFQEAGDNLGAVEIDGGAGCVAPTVEAATSNEYAPLSRPLFIYSDATLLGDAERPEILGFTKFYVENSQELSTDVGYVPISDELLQEQLEKLAAFE
jgi:phosphate transport system substrate-binding protein